MAVEFLNISCPKGYKIQVQQAKRENHWLENGLLKKEKFSVPIQ